MGKPRNARAGVSLLPGFGQFVQLLRAATPSARLRQFLVDARRSSLATVVVFVGGVLFLVGAGQGRAAFM